MTRLSVAVIDRGDTEQFENTIASVLQHRPTECEVVCVHKGPYADPYSIGSEVRLLEVSEDQSLLDAINVALRASYGRIFHPLLAGVKVTDGWCSAAVAHFADFSVGSVSPMVVDGLTGERTGGVDYTSAGRRIVRYLDTSDEESAAISLVGPTLQAGFYRKSALIEAGGFEPSLGAYLADVDIGVALRTLNFATRLEPSSVILSHGAKLEPARGFRAGLEYERLFMRHAPFVGWFGSLLFHPAEVVCESFRGERGIAALAGVLGRCYGWMEFWSHAEYHAQLEQELERPHLSVYWPEDDEHEAADSVDILPFRPSQRPQIITPHRRAA